MESLTGHGEPVHWTWLADIVLAWMLVGAEAVTVNALGPEFPQPFVAVTLMAVVPAIGIPLSTPVAAFSVAQPGNPVALQVIVGSPTAVNVYE